MAALHSISARAAQGRRGARDSAEQFEQAHPPVAEQHGDLAVDGLAEQTELIFDNMISVLKAADMELKDLVKLTIFCCAPGGARTVREIRNKRLGSHCPASTFVQVAGLANPKYLVEIEGEAIREA